MDVKDYRNLYEGLTQEDDSFRQAMYEWNDSFVEPLLSDLELAKNRLNYAMLGVHPIYQREVELSGMVNYSDNTLELYGKEPVPFANLDASYVAFLEQQKRIYNVKEQLPLSSVALKTSHQWLTEEGVNCPDISDIPMNVPDKDFSVSREVLEKAFARNMTMMCHIQEEMKKHHLDETYAVHKDDLIQYCQSNSFSFQFNQSVDELNTVLEIAEGMDGLLNQ